MTISSEAPETTLNEPPAAFRHLLDRAAAADIEAEVRTLSNDAPHRSGHYMLLAMPNGRRTRQVTVFPRDVENFANIQFEKYVVLGDYVAVVNKHSGRIEAQVTGSGPTGRFRVEHTIQQVPGVETTPDGDLELDQEAFEEEAAPTRSLPVSNWRLAVEQDGVSIEISPATAEFGILLQGGITVKVDGVKTTNHDAAVQALERYATAMLFELDLVYGLPVQLAKRRRANRRRRPTLPDHPPRFPRNQYAGQALELYQYGREAAGLPLLEYLAYYQSLEYFFPFFAREQTVNSVRSQLLNPAFDALNDAALNRLINLAAAAARSGMAEREQLRATIRACMNEADVREFIELSPEYTDHFCSKKQTIKGVGAIQLNGSQVDLRDQAADRIYAIRCRIVHSKQDGGGTSEEVLLPSSAEAESLQADIEMLRLVAQRALIARAARA